MDATVSKGPLSDEELAAAKGYMRLEGTEDDGVVTACVLAAREYLTQAGISLPVAGTGRRALYDLVCHAWALCYYDRRDPVITGAIVAQNPVQRQTLTQLKLTEPIAE